MPVPFVQKQLFATHVAVSGTDQLPVAVHAIDEVPPCHPFIQVAMRVLPTTNSPAPKTNGNTGAGTPHVGSAVVHPEATLQPPAEHTILADGLPTNPSEHAATSRTDPLVELPASNR